MPDKGEVIVRDGVHCPDCGAELVHQEGTELCPECGWTPCLM
jgi:uncharacterized Zn finger protein (UPF0148 family)